MIDCSDGWFAGTITNHISMEKINLADIGNRSYSWGYCDLGKRPIGLDADGNPIKGTPKHKNSWLMICGG